MCKFQIVKIKKEYFEDFNLTNVLDIHDDNKNTRPYLFLSIEYKTNKVLVPLKSELKMTKDTGKIGYSLPSETRVDGGLDYRRILIVKNSDYIDFSPMGIATTQNSKLNNDYDIIVQEVEHYIDGFIKIIKKNNVKWIPYKYKYSSLYNYKDILINDVDDINSDTLKC